MAKLHPFEKAGLGQAPFRLIGVTQNWFTVPGVPEATKPGSSCDYCGTGIAYEFWIVSADGKKHKVGCDCILRIHQDDPQLATTAQAHQKRLERDLRHEKEATRIEDARRKLQGKRLRATLDCIPHPYGRQAAQGYSALDWCEWMLANAGNTGGMRVARYLDKVRLLSDDEIRLALNRIELDSQKRLQQKAKEAEAESARISHIREANRPLLDKLLLHARYINDQPENFAASMVDFLRQRSATELSERQAAAICDIVAGREARRGSKAYDAAYDAAWALCRPATGQEKSA